MMMKTILKTILSCWAISIPLKMFTAYVNGWIYHPITVDLAFDWTPLLAFGLWMFYEGVREYYSSSKLKQIHGKV
jgi:hypothetical protein